MQSDTRSLLASRVIEAMRAAFGDQAGDDPKLTPATRPDFGDYQCNAAMSLSKKVRARPRDVAAKILENLDVADICESPLIAGPGFINLTLHDDFVNTKLNLMLSDRSRLGVAEREPPQRIVVDFSSPNIAKDMHVGHLRSTIIGDTLARILEFLGHTTIRLNHTGDWGTQFGQLITYMKDECPQLLEEGHDSEAAATIGDLVEFYRRAKNRYDDAPDFKNAALAEVVQLQSGNPDTLRAWNLICNLSRIEFQKIYDRLDIKLEERGESFYNPFLADVVKDLQDKGLAVKNDGAMVIFLEGDKFKGGDGKPLPVIVQKSDGGFLYATTDLAAVRYRSLEDKADRILYVTDVGQSLHFQQIFAVCRKAQLLPEHVSLEHVPFGLVQGADGKKFKTRAGAAPKLSELLDEARDRVRIELEKRAEEDVERAREAGDAPPPQKSDEEMQNVSEVIGVAAVKYADLQNNRTSNYKFSFDKMVKLEGNTAPYIMYAFARVQGIYRTAAAASGDAVAGVDPGVEFAFEKKEERALSKILMRLPEILSELERDLLPHVLCDYVKTVTTRFNQFYEECPVLHASSDELKLSRLALCQISADTLQLCLGLLGIPTLDRI
ncbi:Arginine--tRNA ligase [Gracilariopsis chorda]|uniref:arginine--tRNA ligase n=1 Tax=Gracilariopsis chorda TaxID=448386 RepID=A0A2V3J6F0_9FLOR|nr:Arginine--tRNA ligase [Gracilariopsis chorda]|eukprot:PXF49979.1 Arginine--tRNA ligase [Gracilariopsis chorda]